MPSVGASKLALISAGASKLALIIAGASKLALISAGVSKLALTDKANFAFLTLLSKQALTLPSTSFAFVRNVN